MRVAFASSVVSLCLASMPATAALFAAKAVDSGIVGHPDPIIATGDSDFVTLARRYGLAFDTLAASNPDVDPYAPLGAKVTVPTRTLLPRGYREGIVINLPELRLYHYRSDGSLETYPVGIGRSGTETPLGSSRVTRVDSNPAWRPPDSIREEYRVAGIELPDVVPPGPKNPLGTHAIRLDLPGYLLHGTSAPDGVGMRVSHGCIRLYNEDVERLAASVLPGSSVHIIDQPIKWRIEDDVLMMEAHRPLAGAQYRSSQTLRTLLQQLRDDVRAHGFDEQRVNAWIEERYQDDQLFTGMVEQLSLHPMSPPGG